MRHARRWHAACSLASPLEVNIKPDLVAGLTLAAYLLPAGIGDASLAGLPPEAGLYACLFSGLVFWIFCSSRQTVVTVTSALSLLVGASVGELAAGDPSRHTALAACLALMVAAIAIAAWLVRAGTAIGFFSETVLVGFKAGLAFYLASTQLPKLLGFSGAHGDFWHNARHVLSHIGDTHVPALLVGLAALAVMIAGKVWLRNRPVAFVVVVGGILAARLFDLQALGVKLLGEVPQGLPLPVLPHVTRADLNALLPTALAAFVLAAVETSAIGRMFAQKHDYTFDANRELLAVGVGNVCAGLGRGFPVSGGMSQSLVNESAGARSPISGLIAALFTLFVVLFASGLLRNLPQPVLAAIVLAAVMSLVDLHALREIRAFSRTEFLVALAAFFGVLGSGPANGVLLGAAISIVLLLRQASRPRVVELGRVAGTRVFGDLTRNPEFARTPGVLVVRCESALLYFNTEYVRERIFQLLEARQDVRLVIFFLGQVPRLDLAGAGLLADLHKRLDERGIAFQLAEAHGEVRDALRRSGFERTHGTLEPGQTVDAILAGWTPKPPGAAGAVIASLVALCLLLPAPAAFAGQAGAAAPQVPAAHDPERDEPQPAPVELGGEPVLWFTVGAGPYSPEFRAARASTRLADAIRDRTLRDPTVTVVEVDGSSELRAGSHLLLVVTARDAASVGVPRSSLAQQYARMLEDAIRTERLRYAPGTLLRSGIYGAVATLLFALVAWAIVRVTAIVRRAVTHRFVPRNEALRAMKAEVLSGDTFDRAAGRIVFAIRAFAVLLALDLYLTYVLGLFPWTRAVSNHLLDYVMTPIRAVGAAFVGYLPNLLFLLVIAVVINVAIRLVGVFFRQIEQGRLVFASFPAEWADPTLKIVRVLLIAFGVVVAFPYLPAASSPAFTGVSVFIGVLVSLASSSALSNVIAGIVLTYTGAFRIGDRVKLGDTFGDIVETSLLATRVRTIKNEEVTIPNGIALGSAVTNYSRHARTIGLILHTSVTIGYDTPWRTVDALLTEAARGTPGILPEPAPFVWQTALNDFYVTYEINAYTASANKIMEIYAGLHARIQDAFFTAGVEIMSPHYTSVRDGNTVAIPEAQRPSGYRAPSFRVENSLAPRPDADV